MPEKRSKLEQSADEEDLEGLRRRQQVAKGVPLAGKSTLNRLELSPSTASSESRYKKIVYDEVKMENFFVSTFISTFLILALFTGGVSLSVVMISFLMGLFCSAFDLIPLKIDDNLTIPIFLP